jgi:hypothetical protein
LEAQVLVELEGELNWRALTDVEQVSRIPPKDLCVIAVGDLFRTDLVHG